MRRAHAARLLLLLVLLPIACAAPPPPRVTISDSILYPHYFPAAGGVLRFRIPAGWFDVTADSQRNGTIIWLVRSDYASAITVSEVHLDEQARQEVHRGGLLPLARAMAGLTGGEGAATMVEAPRPLSLGGAACCSYQTRPSPRDEAQTILLDTGERIYAVVAMRPLGDRSPGSDVLQIQQAFVAALRW